ncbi:hypothetical protein L345_09142, partial [Ophiophagus hannah]
MSFRGRGGNNRVSTEEEEVVEEVDLDVEEDVVALIEAVMTKDLQKV